MHPYPSVAYTLIHSLPALRQQRILVVGPGRRSEDERDGFVDAQETGVELEDLLVGWMFARPGDVVAGALLHAEAHLALLASGARVSLTTARESLQICSTDQVGGHVSHLLQRSGLAAGFQRQIAIVEITGQRRVPFAVSDDRSDADPGVRAQHTVERIVRGAIDCAGECERSRVGEEETVPETLADLALADAAGQPWSVRQVHRGPKRAHFSPGGHAGSSGGILLCSSSPSMLQRQTLVSRSFGGDEDVVRTGDPSTGRS